MERVLLRELVGEFREFYLESFFYVDFLLESEVWKWIW